ncbi:MAG: hypothetical protein AAB515_03190 [Patescibacteria group bacterium]
MNPLEQAILRTVAYFDMFSYPLTAWEVWKWGFASVIASPAAAGRGNLVDTAQSKIAPAGLGFAEGDGGQVVVATPRNDNVYSYRAVEEGLVKSPLLQEKLQQQSGFYFLKGQQGIVATRQGRYRLALLKFGRAKKFARVLARLPFVRAVAVCNSLATSNARAESDIDVFIITSPGHVWTARLFAAGWAQLRKLRPQVGNRADKVCLSFFITQDVGDLRAVRNADDPYFTMWLATLVPLYDPQGLLEKLWQANPWAAAALPNAAPRAIAEQRRLRALFVQPMLEALVASAWFERWAERFQQQRLPPALRTLANQDTRVVLNNTMLKFHDNDRRDEYARQFRARCAALGI